MSKHILLRKKGSGLLGLRNILSKMEHRSDVLIRNTTAGGVPQGDHTKYIFNWGNYDQNVIPSGYTVLNKVSDVASTSNKRNFRRYIQSFFGVDTVTPKSFFTTSDVSEYFNSQHTRPLIVRPSNHTQGRNLYVVNNMSEFNNVISRHPIWYASEFIDKKQEFRVFIAQGRVVYVVEKIVDDITQPAWNVHAGGRFENVRFTEWNESVVNVAIKSMNATELIYGAVDVITTEDTDGSIKAYMIEINTAPSQETDYWGTCVAKVFDYIIDNDYSHIPTDLDSTALSIIRGNVVGSSGMWKLKIHPAISEKAITPTSQIVASLVLPEEDEDEEDEEDYYDEYEDDGDYDGGYSSYSGCDCDMCNPRPRDIDTDVSSEEEWY